MERKRVLFLLIFSLFTSHYIAAQKVGSLEKLAPQFLLVVAKEYPNLNIDLETNSPAYFIEKGGVVFYDAIVFTRQVEDLRKRGFWIRSVHAQFATAYLTASDLLTMAAIEHVNWVQPARRIPMRNDVARGLSGGDFLQKGMLNNTSYTGKNVIVAIVDIGLDWMHLDFRNPSDSLTRVYRIWDQGLVDTVIGEETPYDKDNTLSCCNYGVEYTKADINNELDGSPPNFVRTTDQNSHGTHVAGTAAGNGQAYADGKYKGMAPESVLLIVETNFSDAGIIDALDYINKRALDTNMAVAVNMSLGGHYTPHDGTDPLDLAIDDFSGRGRAVAVAGGNEGSSLIHISGTVADGSSTQVVMNMPSGATPGNDYLGYLFWFDSDDSITATIVTPNNFSLTASPDTAVSKSTSNGVLNLANDVYVINNNRYIDFLIYDSTGSTIDAGNYTLTLTNPSGGNSTVTYHAWQYAATFDPSVSGSSANYTVGSPGTSDSAITVGSYMHRGIWSNFQGNGQSYSSYLDQDDISSFSSIGPTRIGKQKPDLTAPGQGMISSRSSAASVSTSTIVEGQKHFVNQGTSMATPVVTGAIALLFQEDSTLTASQIKELLTNNARQDGFTGTIPNYTWGYGKLDAFSAMVETINPGGSTHFQVLRYDDWVSPVYSSDLTGSDTLAVRFSPTFLGRVSNVLFHTWNELPTAGDWVFQIYSDSNGAPYKPITDTIHYPANQLIEYSWHLLSLNDEVLLTDQDYHVVFFMENASDAWNIAGENSNVSGRTYYRGSAGWISQPFDLRVRAIMGGSSNVPVPVELATFTATKKDDGALLEWITASEHNNAGFTVEWLTKEDFDSIGFVPGAGNSSHSNYYSFYWPRLQKGYNYFRLKQIDLNGEYTYSPVRTVLLEESQSGLAAIYPNPAESQLYVQPRQQNEACKAQLLDGTGRLILQKEIAGTTSLDLGHLPIGIYYLHLQSASGEMQVEKVVVAR